MIANALRVEVEKYVGQMERSNPLFIAAADGTFTPVQMIQYLTNVRHLISNTDSFLKRARDGAGSRQNLRLAKHYDEKRVEEAGHEVWADGDIERVSRSAAISADSLVLPSVRGLVAFIESSIDEDPALFLSYILFVEYLTVLIGPAWLRLLEERCLIPSSSVTVVGKHVEADRDHVETALDQIDDLVVDPAKLPRMRTMLLDSINHFEHFCAEVTSAQAAEGWIDAGRKVRASAA